MWNDYYEKRDSIGCIIVLLQLGKIKYWDGTPVVHNAIFGTKVFMNSSLPEIFDFRKSYQAHDNFNKSEFKIELYTPLKLDS